MSTQPIVVCRKTIEMSFVYQGFNEAKRREWRSFIPANRLGRGGYVAIQQLDEKAFEPALVSPSTTATLKPLPTFEEAAAAMCDYLYDNRAI